MPSCSHTPLSAGTGIHTKCRQGAHCGRRLTPCIPPERSRRQLSTTGSIRQNGGRDGEARTPNVVQVGDGAHGKCHVEAKHNVAILPDAPGRVLQALAVTPSSLSPLNGESQRHSGPNNSYRKPASRHCCRTTARLLTARTALERSRSQLCTASRIRQNGGRAAELQPLTYLVCMVFLTLPNMRLPCLRVRASAGRPPHPK